MIEVEKYMYIITDEITTILVDKDIESLRKAISTRASYLSKKEKQVLSDIYKKVTQLVLDNMIILYGSKARGNGNEDSDYDLCIFLKDTDRFFKDTILDSIWEIGFENEMLFQTIIFSYAELFSDKLYKTRHIQSILKEGILIDGRKYF